MKNSSNDTIGNRTRDLLTCSAVPQPTAPPRSPLHVILFIFRTIGPTDRAHPSPKAHLKIFKVFSGLLSEVKLKYVAI